MVKPRHRKVARRRIDVLYNEAIKAASSGRLDRADSYVEMARKMGMRYNVSLPSYFRRRVCGRCYSYLHPGVTCRIRLNRGKLVTRCSACGTINRFPYGR